MRVREGGGGGGDTGRWEQVSKGGKCACMPTLLQSACHSETEIRGDSGKGSESQNHFSTAK